MSQFDYRVYFKKLTDLNGGSITSPQLKVKSFKIDVDLLKKTTSSFDVIQIPNAIEIGDIMGVYDKYGDVIFNGEVSYLNNGSFQCNQMNDIFEDSWLWNNPNLTTIEQTLQQIIVNDYQNNSDLLMRQIYRAFNIQTISNTEQKLQSQEDRYITDFSVFLYDIYEKYGIQMIYDIPFTESNPTIQIGAPTYEKLLISNNTSIFRNFNVTTNAYETNKLIVYSQEMGTRRGTWYATTSGITTNSASLNRPQKINTNIVFSDDDINILKASSLRNNLYNHEITCEMVYDNKLLPIKKLKLGQQVDLYYNNDYYNTLLTGYTLSSTENNSISTITLKFGLVRTSLTGRIYNKLAKRYYKIR